MNATSIESPKPFESFDDSSLAAVMSTGRLLRAYLAEARFECLRMFRVLGFSIPFLVLPAALYLLFGVVLFGDAVRSDPTTGKFLFAAFAVFGVMGPGMFGFGATIATEREQGLLTLKRALPAPPGSYLLAKLLMTMLFAFIVMAMMIPAALLLGHLPLTFAQCAKGHGGQYSRFASLLRYRIVYWHARLRQGSHRARKSYLRADDARLRAVLPTAEIS